MTADTSRVPHDKLMTLAAEAEMEEWPVTSAWYWPRMMALDLRDARTALAERDRELAGYRERLEARIDQCLAAEARVRVLEEVLTQIAESSDTGRGDGLPEPCAALEADAMWAIANAALSDTTKEEQHG